MAHWIIDDKGFGGMFYKCSNCGEIYWDILDKFSSIEEKCPNCGEDIEEDKEEYI